MVPSISFPVPELRKIAAVQAYEERMLFLALLLRNPELRVVYVTSSMVDPDTVDYYLRFLDDPAAARDRLTLVSLDDPSIGSLSRKLLGRPADLDRLRALIGGDAGEAVMLPFNVTGAEQEVADRLGVALCGPPADRVWLGSKSGSREVAARAGVPTPAGVEHLMSGAELEAALVDLRRRRPGAAGFVVKLNNGFSGQGNAIVDARGMATPLPASKTTFCSAEESWHSFEAKVEAEGAIVEELLRGGEVASPSAQLRIGAGGEAELLSTHDQILGGPEGQVYIGCRFPARPAYRAAVSAAAARVAAVLAEEGVVGSFGIDFLVVDGDVYMSEINLRMGGTTHPYWMARLATMATFDPAEGVLVAPDGRPRAYVATDNLRTDRLIGVAPGEVIAAVDKAGLAFDPAAGTGTTLHLLGALRGAGKMGATCIGVDLDDATDRYDRLVSLLTSM